MIFSHGDFQGFQYLQTIFSYVIHSSKVKQSVQKSWKRLWSREWWQYKWARRGAEGWFQCGQRLSRPGKSSAVFQYDVILKKGLDIRRKGENWFLKQSGGFLHIPCTISPWFQNIVEYKMYHGIKQLLEEKINPHVYVYSKHKTHLSSQLLQCEKKSGTCILQRQTQA